jgi:hypothetical protein
VRLGYAIVALAALFGLVVASLLLSAAGPPRPQTVADVLAVGGLPAAELDRRRAEAIALLTTECMADLGLPYQPVPDAPPAIPDADLEPVDWAERWGFGVSTSVDVPPAAPAPLADPNAAWAASLPAPAAARYRAALYGTPDGAAEGCQRAASDEVLGLRDRLLAPLAPALADLETRVAADPGTAAAVAAWRRCVELAWPGWTAPARRTAGSVLIERFTAALADVRDRADLARVQADERRVAAAVARCELDYVGARARITAPYEARFLQEHGERLRAIGGAIHAAERAWPSLATATGRWVGPLSGSVTDRSR